MRLVQPPGDRVDYLRHNMEKLLLQGAQRAGYSTDLWTLRRIGKLIEKEFGVQYTTVEGAPKILWEWSDGTTSDSTAPSVNFGTEESREQRLRVTPWSALRRINIGYDGGDGGSGQIEYVADQHVAEVRNLDLVAPSLREWCASYKKIVSLDFSNFVNLGAGFQVL